MSFKFTICTYKQKNLDRFHDQGSSLFEAFQITYEG